MDNESRFKELNIVPHWYALYTRHHHEKRVTSRLEVNGIDCYLPLNTIYRRWSDRYKKVQEPLFRCYTFLFISLKDRFKVLQLDGAIKLIAFNGCPSPIPQKQIDDIKKILGFTPNVENISEILPGRKVRIISGPLKDIEGIVLSNKNKYRLIMSVDVISQSISVEIDARALEMVNC